jgi:sulfite exporter TauE/SafE/copper chaperone CopZ
MSSSKKQFRIEGMHCVSCEYLLEKELGKLRGVNSCKVSHKHGDAIVECDDKVTMSKIESVVRDCGYRVGKGGASSGGSNGKDKPDYLKIGLTVVVIGLFFWLLGKLEIMKYFPDLGDKVGALTAFPIGVAASLSTCLAVTGGIVLSFGAKVNLHEGEKPGFLVRAMPHFRFHIGRIVGFAILGGLLGAVGGKFEYSPAFTGYLTMLVAVVMFYMGLNILGLVPNITKIGFHLPKSWGRRIDRLTTVDHHLMPVIIGALTFFLPCGFTQTMQLAAATSGSFISGALIMGLFALGTLPVLFGIGLGSTYAYKDRLKTLYRVIGVVVLFFALYSFNSGLVLTGSTFTLSPSSSSPRDSAPVEQNIQTVEMEVDWTFSPSEFVVKKGIPVEWNIYGKNLTGCSNEVIIPSLGIRKKLQPGPNKVEFTPQKAGILPFSCWMGMLRGRFIVVE